VFSLYDTATVSYESNQKSIKGNKNQQTRIANETFIATSAVRKGKNSP